MIQLWQETAENHRKTPTIQGFPDLYGVETIQHKQILQLHKPLNSRFLRSSSFSGQPERSGGMRSGLAPLFCFLGWPVISSDGADRVRSVVSGTLFTSTSDFVYIEGLGY